MTLSGAQRCRPVVVTVSALVNVSVSSAVIGIVIAHRLSVWRTRPRADRRHGGSS